MTKKEKILILHTEITLKVYSGLVVGNAVGYACFCGGVYVGLDGG